MRVIHLNFPTEFLQDFCRNAITPKDFSAYIYTGSAATRAILRGISPKLSFDELTSPEEAVKQYFSSGAGILNIVFWSIAAVLFGLLVLLTPSCCSSKYRSCISCLTCRCFYRDRPRLRPLNNVSEDKIRWTRFLSITTLTLLILAGVSSIIFALLSSSRYHGALCQVTRVLNEPDMGILYEQKTSETDWMIGLKPNRFFGGFNAVDQAISYIRHSYIDNGGRAVLERLQAEVLEVPSALSDSANDLSYPFLKIAKMDDHVVSPLKDVSQEIHASMDILDGALDDLKVEIVRIFPDTLNTASANKLLKDIEKIIADVRNSLMDASTSIRETMYKPYVRYIGGYLLPVLVGIPSLGIVLACGGWITYILLELHYRRGTEPKPSTAAKMLGFLWGNYLLFAALLVAVGGTLICLSGVVSGVRQAVIFGVENRKDGWAKDLDENIYKTCLHPAGDGDLIQDATKSFKGDLHKLVDDVSLESSSDWSLPDGLLSPLDNLERILHVSYPYVLHNHLHFGSCSLASCPENVWLISPHMLFVDTRRTGPVEAVPSAVLSSEWTASIQQATQKLKDYISLVNSNGITGSCDVPSTITDISTYSIQEYLNQISTSWEQCTMKPVSHRLCIDLEYDKIRVCSDTGPSNKIYLVADQSIRPKGNILDRNVPWEFSGQLEAFLQPCLNVVSEAPGVSCSLLHLNTVIVSLMKLEELRAEPHFDTDQFKKILQLRDFRTVASEKIKQAALDFVESESIDIPNIDCKSAAYSAAAVVDGVAEGYFHLIFWTGFSYVLMSIFSFIGWWISLKLFSYFKTLSLNKSRSVVDLKHPSWNRGCTSLMALSKAGNGTNLVKALQSFDTVPNLFDDQGNTLLHNAAFYGDIDTVKFLLRKGANVNALNIYGYTPLAVAAAAGHSSVVAELMNSNADPTIRDGFGDTPLHSAARAGDISIVTAICDNTHSSPTYVDEEGEYALDTARQYNQREVEAFLDPRTPRG